MDTVAGKPIDDQALDGDVVGGAGSGNGDDQAIGVRTGGRPIQLDQDLGVVPSGKRVGAGRWLGIAVNQHAVRNRRQRRAWANRLDAGSRDAEVNDVRSGYVRIGVEDCLAERAGANSGAVTRVGYQMDCGRHAIFQ